MTEGVVYIATSTRFVKEAITSARSVVENSPSLSIGIITNEHWKSELLDGENLFDDCIVAENIHDDIRDKCFNLRASPYDRTLYLDTDTYICADISEIFNILHRFDFAAAHAPVRESNKRDSVPNSFPDFNGGVLLFKKNEVMMDTFRNWERYYRTQIESEHSLYPTHDQATLRQALFESNARITVLPPEYNCRYIFPGYVEATVKILHGNDRDLTTIGEKINTVNGMRIHTGQLDREILTLRDGLLRYVPGISMKTVHYPTGKWEHKIRGIWKKLYNYWR